MPEHSSTTDAKVARFWDRFIKLTRNQGIKPPFDQWHVIHAERYINFHADKRLPEHSPEDVVGYLGNMGRKGGLKEWQFRQIVDAIRILFQVVNAPWVEQVDWDYWKDSARPLSPSHPTIARDAGADQPCDTSSGKGALGQARDQYQKEFAALIAEIRRRGYSIRTEQAYEAWLARFILFSGRRDPQRLGAADVVAFLQYLAVQRNVATSTQNQALNALVFYYDQVLNKPLGEMGDFTRVKRPRRLPVVLTRREVARLFEHMDGINRLMASPGQGVSSRIVASSL